MIYYFGIKTKSRPRHRTGFTLIEMMVVMGIILIVAAISLGAFSNVLSGGFTEVVSDMTETLQQARAYAMSNNTYVYVGFDEVNATSTASPPPDASSGANYGLVLVGIAASIDGTSGFNVTTTTPSATKWIHNNSAGTFNLMAISKLMKFPNVHLPAYVAANFAASGIFASSGNMIRPTPGSTSYYLSNPNTPGAAPNALTYGFNWPMGATAANSTYNFAYLIRFGPQGDATLITSTTTASTVPTADYIEIDVEPSHGTAITTTKDVAAIQIDGTTGLVKSYRP
jgi:prepilin-type N-terminal cleavage/methylation domain-containing protein